MAGQWTVHQCETASGFHPSSFILHPYLPLPPCISTGYPIDWVWSRLDDRWSGLGGLPYRPNNEFRREESPGSVGRGDG